MMNFLVTGATGLVGTHVMRELASRSIRAAGLSRSGGTYAADLLDPQSLVAIPWSEFTHVIHCAAAIPARTNDFSTNTQGTENLLECLPDSLKSLVLVSSISASLDTDYGRSKHRAEVLCSKWANDHRVPLSIFRPTSIFGKGMAETTILPSFVKLAKSGQSLRLSAPADYVQNFVWANDVAGILVDAAVQGRAGEWELSSDDTLDGLELAQAITGLYGGIIDDVRGPATGTKTEFNNSKLKHDFACEFTPFISALRSSFEV